VPSAIGRATEHAIANATSQPTDARNWIEVFVCEGHHQDIKDEMAVSVPVTLMQPEIRALGHFLFATQDISAAIATSLLEKLRNAGDHVLEVIPMTEAEMMELMVRLAGPTGTMSRPMAISLQRRITAASEGTTR